METSIKDKIKLIKFSRLQPDERFVHNIFRNLELYIHPSKELSESIFYMHNGITMFEYQKNYNYFWCNDGQFFRVLYNDGNKSDLVELLIPMINEYINEIDKESIPTIKIYRSNVRFFSDITKELIKLNV